MKLYICLFTNIFGFKRLLADDELENNFLMQYLYRFKKIIKKENRSDYVFHHYMQDGFDDKGWGCAYRSF